MKDAELVKNIEIQMKEDVQLDNLDVFNILKRTRMIVKEWSKVEHNKVDVKIKEVDRCLESAGRSSNQNSNKAVFKKYVGRALQAES